MNRNMLFQKKVFNKNKKEKFENDIRKYNGKALVLRGCENESSFLFCIYSWALRQIGKISNAYLNQNWWQ